MRVIWLMCFILWSVLLFNLGELKQKKIAFEQFELITDDAISRIEKLELEKIGLMRLCQMQEEMCVDGLVEYENDLVDMYIMLIVKERMLNFIHDEYFCLKKQEI